MDPILEIARAHRLTVIEDAAQAHGAEYRGRRAGSLGHLACFSFYPGKNLGAYGEGGAVVTGNADYAGTIRMLRDWGQERKYVHVLRGFNYRMDGIQGAILGVKLRYLENWTEARRKHAAAYSTLLADAAVGLPYAEPFNRHVFHIYAVRVFERARIAERLAAAGIQTGIHYPVPVHLMPAWSFPRYAENDFPAAEQAAEEVLSLPMYPELTETDLRTVAAALRQALTIQ